MKYLIASVLFIGMLASFPSEARHHRHRHPAHTHPEHVTELDQLGRIAILLKTRVDQPGFQAKKNDYACGLSAKQAGVMLRAVHAEIDAKVSAEAKQRNDLTKHGGGGGQKFSDSDWRNCAHSCTCFIYEDLLAKADAKGLTEYDVMSRDYFKAQTTNLDEVESMACARQVKNFCGTPVYRRLKTASKDMESDTSEESGEE